MVWRSKNIGSNGKVSYDVILTERRVEDLQTLQKYGRKDEIPFQAVEAVSKTLASTYETFVHPVLAPMVSPAAAKVAMSLSPQRMQRWAVSDLNPFLWPIKGLAEMTRANRAPGDAAQPSARRERYAATMVSASWDLYRDLRDASVETAFFRIYTTVGLGMTADESTGPIEEVVDARSAPPVKKALAHIDEGSRTAAIVRAALLVLKAGTGRRRLSAMKRTRDLVGKDIGLIDMPTEVARNSIREQSYIVDFEPERALSALPKLLPTSEDRRITLDLLDRLEGKIESNPTQTALLGEMRHLLAQGRPSDKRKSESIARRTIKHGNAAAAAESRRTRPVP